MHIFGGEATVTTQKNVENIPPQFFKEKQFQMSIVCQLWNAYKTMISSRTVEGKKIW